MPKVAGYCPMCGQETLYLALSTSQVECLHEGCPDPDAVSKILADPETEHIAVFDDDGFSVQHPLRERISGLFGCEVNRRLRQLDGPPEPGLGRYRVTLHQPDAYSESYRPGDAGLDFEKLP